MLMWHRNLWLIDHGAALYVHHGNDAFEDRGSERFAMIRDHVLLPIAEGLPEASRELSSQITRPLLEEIVSKIPDIWFTANDAYAGPERFRKAYVNYLLSRLEEPQAFVEEAIRARTRHI